MLMKMSYAYKPNEEKAAARAYGRDLEVSAKDSREVVHAIRGLKIAEAEKVLFGVMTLQQPIPFKRHKRKLSHKPGIGPGRYPRNAAAAVLKILENAKANAKVKGLDEGALFVKHVAVHKGIHKRPRGARAFSKGPQMHSRRATVEIILEEKKTGQEKIRGGNRKEGAKHDA